MGNFARWVWRHRYICSAAMLLAGILALNGQACMHAWSMTHFTEGVTRTKGPESLSAVEKAKILLTGIRLPKPRNTTDPGSIGLSFTRHRFTGSDGTQYDAWYIPCAESREIAVLFHGYGASKSSLLQDASVWHGMGYETFLVDFRGCGDSSGRETTIGFREADDVVAACRYVERIRSGQPLVLFGRSMGAAAVLRAVGYTGLRPRAIVVESSFDQLLSTARNRFHAMGLPSFPFAELLVFWGGIQHGYSGFRHNPAEYARHVHCPVLVLNGEQDPRVTKDQASSIFNNLAGTKQMVFFPGVGHQSCLGAQPSKWKACVEEFLNRQQAATARPSFDRANP